MKVMSVWLGKQSSLKLLPSTEPVSSAWRYESDAKKIVKWLRSNIPMGCYDLVLERMKKLEAKDR